MGLDAVVINNNPETVSTDYDACSRLYFEPLDTESVLDVIDHERALTGEPPIVLLTFGGQTAIDLAKRPRLCRRADGRADRRGDRDTEDRERFAQLLDELGLEGPRGLLAEDAAGLRAAVEALGLPVIVRPSWVIGGRGIAVLRPRRTRGPCWPPRSAGRCASTSWSTGVELDVDAISDGTEWCVPGILEQLDPPGDPLGRLGGGACRRRPSRAAAGGGRGGGGADRAGARPARDPERADDRRRRAGGGDRGQPARQPHGADRGQGHRARRRGRCGALRAGRDAAPRRVAAGLAPDAPLVAVKAPVGSLWRLPGVDRRLGPEMRSTGEVLGLAPRYADARAGRG